MIFLFYCSVIIFISIAFSSMIWRLILIPSIIYKFTFDSIHDFYIFAFLFHDSAFWLYVL